MSKPARRLHDNPAFSVLLHGVLAEMIDTDLMLVVMIAEDHQRSRERTMRFLNAGHVAVIHVSPHEEDPLIAELASRGLPVIIWGGSLNPDDHLEEQGG